MRQQNYVPYFYIIRHKESNKLYAGSRTSKHHCASPDTFMTEGGYSTSSKEVQLIIQQCGLEAFEILRIRTFSTGEEAYRYESRFLSKVNAKDNELFFNRSNNNGTFSTLGKKMSDETKEKIRKKNSGRTISEETRQKLRDACSGEKNGMYGKKHTQKAKEIQRTRALQRELDSNETRRKKARPGKLNGMYGNGDKISGEKHGFYGQKRSEADIKKMRENRKDNLKIEINGTAYRSVSEASRVLGISRYKIRQIGKLI